MSYAIYRSKDAQTTPIRPAREVDAIRLRRKFNDLLENIRTTLDKLTLNKILALSEVVHAVNNYLSIENCYSHCTSIQELFTEIQPYCNYLNSELLEYLIGIFSYIKEIDDFKTRVAKYSRELLAFHKSVKLSQSRNLIALSRLLVCHRTDPVSNFKIVFWKEQKLSLHQLLKVMECWFGSFAHFVQYLINYQAKFFIPSSHVESLRSLVTVNRNKICQFGIRQVYIDDELIISSSYEEGTGFEEIFLTAASVGDCLLLLELLELGSSMNYYTNKQEETPLMIAFKETHYPFTQILLLEGANPHICDSNGHTIFTVALQATSISPTIIKTLLTILPIPSKEHCIL